MLTATGGINGTFNPDIVGVKNKVELFYDANNVYLCDHCKFSDLVPLQLPFFPAFVNQIAGAIDAAIDANITLPPRFANLLALALQPQRRAQLVNALTQLTGEVHTGADTMRRTLRRRAASSGPGSTGSSWLPTPMPRRCSRAPPGRTIGATTAR